MHPQFRIGEKIFIIFQIGIFISSRSEWWNNIGSENLEEISKINARCSNCQKIIKRGLIWSFNINDFHYILKIGKIYYWEKKRLFHNILVRNSRDHFRRSQSQECHNILLRKSLASIVWKNISVRLLKKWSMSNM